MVPGVLTPERPSDGSERAGERRTGPSCNGCGAVWSGLSACHCGASTHVTVPLAVWDSDSGFRSQGFTEVYECPVDGGGIPSDAITDLVGAQARPVQANRLGTPDDIGVHRVVLNGGQWTEIRWGVVGPVVVDVVNVVLGRDPTVDHPVFVGLDVVLRSDAPAEADVPVGAGVTTRLVRRDLLAGGQPAGRATVTGGATRATEASLRSAGNDLGAPGAGSFHGMSLQLDALCHRTFAGIGLFDRHRDQHGERGKCVDPATLTKGTPIVFRDGMWRGPEMDEATKAKRFGK